MRGGFCFAERSGRSQFAPRNGTMRHLDSSKGRFASLINQYLASTMWPADGGRSGVSTAFPLPRLRHSPALAVESALGWRATPGTGMKPVVITGCKKLRCTRSGAQRKMFRLKMRWRGARFATWKMQAIRADQRGVATSVRFRSDLHSSRDPMRAQRIPKPPIPPAARVPLREGRSAGWAVSMILAFTAEPASAQARLPVWQ